LYDELAEWWPLLSDPSDYAEEATYYATQLKRRCGHSARTLLELGSGGGNNASHVKTAFEELVLVDAAPGMLAVSRALNPECEHRVGDMRSIRLGREFDCVFVHDAIGYVTSLEDRHAVAATVFIHCRPGGSFLIAPDFVRESFRAQVSHGGHDGPERALRYLQWTWDPDPSDQTYTVDFAFLLRDEDGTVRVRHDRHVLGLFSTAQWLEALERVGFVPAVERFRHSEVPTEMSVFVGNRPDVQDRE
jgi:SAM-dependent methyltransferase